jgi:ornithine cyclodeaminase/alanine dehydrogenase
MQQIELTMISQTEIQNLDIPIRQIIELVEKGMREYGLKRVENPPKPGIHATLDSFIHAMPAYFKKLDIGGIKWVSGYPGNREHGFPQIIGILILNDMKTGVPKCVMDATWITAVRTAAVSALTAKFCARKDASVLGIIGCGVQGKYNLLALKEVLPNLTKIKVMDINNETAQRYKDELENQTDLNIEIYKSIEEVAKGSDIILTATQRLSKPFIRNEWFEAGSLGIGLEASRAWYGDAILTADKFITDSWEQTQNYHIQGAFPAGLPKSYIELGDIVSGKCQGREKKSERIIAINIGIACSDIIVADYIFNLAKKNKVGIKWQIT